MLCGTKKHCNSRMHFSSMVVKASTAPVDDYPRYSFWETGEAVLNPAKATRLDMEMLIKRPKRMFVQCIRLCFISMIYHNVSSIAASSAITALTLLFVSSEAGL